MFDVFYTGPKPNLFAHESAADSVEVAIEESKTHSFWYLNGNNDYSKFDFNWVPDKWEAHQWHIFPDQWSKNSETYFINKQTLDSDARNYNTTQFVTRTDLSHRVSLKSPPTRWFVPEGVMLDSVDFSWHPDPMDPPYIYHLPTKYYKSSGVTYTMPEATQEKFIQPFTVNFLKSKENWHLPDDVNVTSVDFTWRPDSLNAPFIYRFPTKYNKASGVEYRMPGSSVCAYVRPFYITHLQDKNNWVIPDDVDESIIDFTWRPDPLEPPYIYKFPSKWARDSGLEYHVPNAQEYKYISNKYGSFVYDITASFNANTRPRYYIETTVEDLIADHKDEIFWALSKEMNYDQFDFSWHPDNSQRNFLHIFGSQWAKHAQTFYVDAPSLSDHPRQNFIRSQAVRATSNTDIFYVDKSNSGSSERYKALCASHKNITKIRYVKDIYATMQRASKKSPASKFWIISSDNDYTDFNFDWHAEPWQDYMLHVFGSEEQKWSDTYLVNKHTFDDHTRWCEDIKNMPDLNFVTDQKVKAINVNDIFEIDFGRHNTLKMVQHNTLKTTRFVDSYLSVIKRVVAQSTSEYIWMISNICDYSNFNFDWRPEIWMEKSLHIFGEADYKGKKVYGDTFLIHVATFKEQMNQLEKLEDYKPHIEYSPTALNGDPIAPRLPYDQVPYTGDDLTNTIKSHRFNSPYALFFPEGQDISTINYNPSVWHPKHRAIHTFTESGSVVLAPRDTLQYLDTQCYDYPEIKRQKAQFLAEKPLDIIFISNGESTAELMYDHLIDVTKNDDSLVVKRVDGVNGRAAAYKAAAEASDTDWAFNVFAKLEVDVDFDFHWQPDRLQEPKHYIFHALNPINGLEYGHQGLIAYNKKLVLETDEWGLDFTLSKEHEIVPIRSGIAKYDSDPWIVWRTAFREVIKLLASNTDCEARERLQRWYRGKEGKYGYMSVNGATDATKYYKVVKGEHDKLLLTFEWVWLKEYYDEYYGDTP